MLIEQNTSLFCLSAQGSWRLFALLSVFSSECGEAVSGRGSVSEFSPSLGVTFNRGKKVHGDKGVIAPQWRAACLSQTCQLGSIIQTTWYLFPLLIDASYQMSSLTHTWSWFIYSLVRLLFTYLLLLSNGVLVYTRDFNLCMQCTVSQLGCASSFICLYLTDPF